MYYEEKKEFAKAITAYEKAIALMANPMNNLAWLYLQEQEDQIETALPLSQLAVQLTPHDANHLDTLAEILSKKWDYQKALSLMETAAKLDEQYQYKLPQW